MRTSLLIFNGLLTTGFVLAQQHEPDRRGISDYITAGLYNDELAYSVVLDAPPTIAPWTTLAMVTVTNTSVPDIAGATTTVTLEACPVLYTSSVNPLGATSFWYSSPTPSPPPSESTSSWYSSATPTPPPSAPTSSWYSSAIPSPPPSTPTSPWYSSAIPSPPPSEWTPAQSATIPIATAASTGTLTNKEQVGDSILGTLSQLPFPKWLNDADNKPYTKPPWGDRTAQNSDASIESNVPITHVTRHYDFTVSRNRFSPDGVLRDMIVINGQFPGPAIEANWGDEIVVTVRNNITAPGEGTAMHWHGMLQRGSQWEDGVPSVSQCPLAPGESYTYKFRAEIYGTSFYHAHYSAQYTAGVVGPMVVYGPWVGQYDIDVGPVMLSDWNHIPYFSMVDDVVGTDLSKIPPYSDSGLINGHGQFDCSQPSYSNSSDWLASNLPSNLVWTCVDGAPLAKFRFETGKTHRLRLMNVGADGVQKFSIDGHTMTVIANDYVPVVPYTADVITLGVGQRTDILVTADQDSTSSWWMRTQLPGQDLCGGLGTPTGPGGTYPQILAAIYYTDADTTVSPTSSAAVNDISCDNQPLNTTQPIYPITPSANPYIQPVALALTLNATGSFNFLINNQTFHADFNQPLLYKAAAGNTSFPDDPQWNVYNFGNNRSVVLNVTNYTPFPHPFHLHGHTFYVLNTGEYGATWDGTAVNPENPQRRDVQIVPEGGYAAIQFEMDNPGVWPFHCHAAWHLSGGMGMNIISRPDEIRGIPHGERERNCFAWDAWANSVVVDQIDSGS